MKFEKIEEVPSDWDNLIKNFQSKTLFHELFWHKHILSIYKNSRMVYYSISEDGKIVGYFCGLVIKKFGLKIMGSPLKGTGTNYMGPLINTNVDQSKFIKAFINMCKKEKIAYSEISNDILNPEVMQSYKFRTYYNVTHLVTITDNEDTMLKNMKSTGRNRLKNALKNNLQVEHLDSTVIVREYIEQLKEVYGKQGMSLPFGKERVQSLCEVSEINKRVLKLGIKYGNQIIATGLFPFDENSIYFWGAASWIEFQYLLPNEIIHWEVLKFALKNNIKVYNMCGGNSQFKNKFGGEDVPHLTYSISIVPFLNILRNLYTKVHWIKLKIKKKFSIH